MIISRSFRADFPVFFRISFPVSDRLGRGGHLVGDREVGLAVEFDGKPHSAVDLRVSLARIQRPQILFRNQKQHSVDFGPLLEVDICVKPLGDLVVPLDGDAERGSARRRHPERVHVGAVGEI